MYLERPIQSHDSERATFSPAAAAADALTPQQMRVLVALQCGRSNKVIARDLGITESTVKAHVSEILRKLGVVSRTQAAIRSMNASAHSCRAPDRGDDQSSGIASEAPSDASERSALRLSLLTAQQRRVLRMLQQGLMNKQIAYDLGIRESTAKAHVSEILRKLGVCTRTQAVIEFSRLDGAQGGAC